MKRERIINIIFIIVLLLSTAKFLMTKETVGAVTYGKLNDDDSKVVYIEIEDNNILNTECSLDNENWVNEVLGKCVFNLKSGDYTVYIRNAISHTQKDFNVSINEIKSFDINLTKWYLAHGETVKIIPRMEYIGLPGLDITYTSDDSNIATVDANGVVTGVNDGTTKIHAKIDGFEEKTMEVITTDIIRKPELDDNKPVVKCQQYTEEEAALLDDILQTRVEQRGVGTRAALIEVIRFMTLSLRVKVPYFYEHGRMQPYNSKARKVDGEGRFYHKGLYLSASKYDLINKENVAERKAMWGCPLTNYDDTDGWTIGAKKPNGLDCSGFVSFSLYNSGQDPGDVGAGINDSLYEMSDFGKKNRLTYEFANSDQWKVGDMIGRSGHVALIAGKDDEYIYISESLLRGRKKS